MANKITNTLVANITATEDSTQNVIINRSTGNPAIDSSAAVISEYQLLAGATVIGLPNTLAYQVYIKNLDTAKTITVNWTPNGGAAANVIVLQPGDQIIFWTTTGVTGSGITTLTLTPSAAGALVEVFLGG